MIEAFVGESGGPISPDAVACVAAQVDDTALAEAGALALVDEANSPAVVQLVVSGVAACPDSITELLINGLADTGITVSPEAAACVEATVLSDPAGSAAVFAEGGSAADAFGLRLLDACPQLVG